jgi:LuxR family maltose regulon positive regulatory protein
MASRLSVSPNTIKAQVRSIYRKLGASNRHEAIDRATKYGLAI